MNNRLSWVGKSVAIVAVVGMHSAHAQVAADAATTLASDAASTQPAVPSTRDELQQLIQSHALTEMRTIYSGSYGASLLFDIPESTYYIVLFQHKAFWRVIKTTDAASAEAIYHDFCVRADQLSTNELKAARLGSKQIQTERAIEVVQARAKRLQADLQIARAQEAMVNDHQRATRAETAALETATGALQAQLRALRKRVKLLTRQTEADLPKGR